MAEATQLKSRHLTMMGLGSAVGAGLFLGVGLGIQISGTSVLISYAVAGALIALVMWMLGEMAAARPSLGSFSTYAGQAFGHWARFTMGWIYWFMLIMVMGAEITGAAAIISNWFDIAPWIPALIAVAFFAVVNFAAVGGFGEFEFWFAIIKVGVIVAFLVIGALMALGILPGMDVSLAGTNFTDNFLPNGMPGFAAGLLAVAFAFGGIELVTIAAAESENPAHNVATAVRAIIVRIMIFYIGSIVVITMALPFSSIQDADVAADSPFTLVLAAAKIPFAAGFMEAIIALALLSAFNAQIYATSRLVFDMAKDHCAPGFFLKQNRAGSPINAVILSMVFAFASVGLQFWNPPGLLAFLFNAVGGCLLVIWSFIVASFIKLHPVLRDNGELTEIHVPGFPWLPWVTAAALAGLTLLMLFDPAARNQVISVLILASVLVILSFVLPTGQRAGARK
ncbi:amino acid permease [Corynebacterium tuberculostearicum]|uniref:amino acid permease n=1 Tax=Corynebacterium tuberculostearicum TaxID=38304 RepID=UPI0015CCA354|nr:amino acid permease [Corynebacterium tuberculostearicum]NYI55164.1 aromatic amino acid permease [Corynebacterium tuberculostearicum]QQU81479.1 amino acid permease [Corynebacterium tuberculostearicum]